MNIKSIKPHFIVLLLFSITIGLYYGSLVMVQGNQNILNLDDNRVMMYLFENRLHLSDIFNPDRHGKYYRPVIDLSYLIDQRIWGDTPSGYRLTNIVIHAFNSVLLFIVSSLLLFKEEQGKKISFYTALLFSIHPVAVESVSWISGRTDPLAAFWSLLAIIFYLTAKQKRKGAFAAMSVIFIVAAILSKEVALAAPLVIMGFEVFYSNSFGCKRGKYSLTLSVLLLAAIAVYFVTRFYLISNGNIGFELLEERLFNSKAFLNLKQFFAAYGFYLKKFVYPFPLNLAIYKINTVFYAVTGFASFIIFFLTFFVKRWRRYHFYFFWALLGLGPAALLSLTDIAWTHWAERYLYFSLAPLSSLSVLTVFSITDKTGGPYRKTVFGLFLLILLIFAVSSYNRSLTMSDNEAIWRDTYKKSPSFTAAYTSYANTLAINNKLDKAEEVLNEAMQLDGAKHLLYFNMGHIKRKRGDYSEAESYYTLALKEAREDKKLVTVGPTLRRDILSSMGDLELEKAVLSDSAIDKKEHYIKAVRYLIRADEESSTPFLLYRIGKLYMRIGENIKAANYFRSFLARWPSDHYSAAAKKMLDRIEKNNG